MNVGAIQDRLRNFTADRDWGQFHTPKNLAIAVAAEAGELIAEFQWLTDTQQGQLGSDDALRLRVEDEIADVAIYLLRLADVLNVDLEAAIHAKIDRNETRYPASESFGSAEKYNRLGT